MTKTLDSILKLEVPVIVRIGQKTLKIRDIADLAPGMIIELNKPADEELDLLINNIPVGQGYAVKIVENFGITITFVGDVKAKLGALGGAPLLASGDSAASDIDDDEASALADQFLAG